MTWTYSGDPSASNVDTVRFLIGDTNTDDQQLSNEEITWLISERGSAYGAAIQACEALGAKYARMVDASSGDVSVSNSQRAGSYRSLKSDLQMRQSLGGAAPYCGGISIAGKQAYEDDTDRVKPFFTRDMHVVGPQITEDEVE